MTKEDIIKALESCGFKKDSAATQKSHYSTTKSKSLTKKQVDNRNSTGWGKGEYIIAEYSEPRVDPIKILEGWKKLTAKHKDQYLILEIDRGVWEIYDYNGTKLGGETKIMEMFTRKPESTEYEQKIFFGCPGTGKSHSVNQIVEEDAIKRAIRFAQYLQTVTKPNGEPLADRTMKGYLATPKIDWVIDIARKCPTISDSIETVYDIEDAEAIEEIRKTVAKTSKDIDGNNMYSSALGHYSKMLEVNTVFRTTFHPDTDYASFVGCYKPQMGSTGNIEYSFCPQVFTEAYITAWENPYTTIYLVIEEINRGNCAQIFGDLFQLLDRKDGYSEYPIKADKDLADYIENKLGKGHKGIAKRELRLPPNLTIFATMNTSDQSLFPMDSAFKRRWDWKYIPIEPSHAESQFEINIHGKTYYWADFLIEVNKRITGLTDSEDKMLGNFFIKDNINEEEFKSKVMFYLWSEVCKDYMHADTFFRSSKMIDGKEEQEEFTFSQLYEKNASETLEGFMKFLGIPEVTEKSEDDSEDDTADEGEED